jgi:hypothetical protein
MATRTPRGLRSPEAVSVTVAALPSIDKLFVKVSPRFNYYVLLGLHQQPTDTVLLFWFLAVLGEDVPPHLPGWIQAPHGILGQDLGVQRRELTRAVARLRVRGILEQEAPRVTNYRINPALVVKGSAEKLDRRFGSGVSEDFIVKPRANTRANIRAMLAEYKTYRARWAEHEAVQAAKKRIRIAG